MNISLSALVCGSFALLGLADAEDWLKRVRDIKKVFCGLRVYFVAEAVADVWFPVHIPHMR